MGKRAPILAHPAAYGMGIFFVTEVQGETTEHVQRPKQGRQFRHMAGFQTQQAQQRRVS